MDTVLYLFTEVSGMSEDFYAEMEQQLLQLRNDILESIAAEDEDFRAMINSMGAKDLGDIAADDIASKKMEALNQHAANRLKSVEAALTRLRNGRYGVCLQCGAPIPEERLRAIPYAVLCIKCKSGEEGSKRKMW
ncbi:MAG: TraR/DksA family transcriptional regulator [Sphaerochaetaceae bacterium]